MSTEPIARPPLDKSRLSHNAALMPDLVVEVVDSLESTNVVAVERAHADAPDGFVLVADHQTAGKGRLDRTWESPAGSSLTFSMVLRPDTPTWSWPWLPLLVGYAVDKTIKSRGLSAGVKWPNDVLVGDKKVAGVLVERVDTPQGPAAIVGVGLNVNLQPDELPVPEATALSIESGVAWDRTDLLIEVLNSIREAYDAWVAGGDLNGMRLAQSYTLACVTIGRQVRVDLPGGEVIEGLATDIDPSGQLLVDTGQGQVAVSAGDVVHVRAVADAPGE